MRRLRRFLDREARRAGGRPSLAEALLTAGAGRYAWYRLRWVTARALLRCLLHVLELALVAAYFPLELFGTIVAIRSVAILAGGAWWGALEQLRGEVRRHVRRREHGRATARIHGWLGLAVDVALVELAVAVAYVKLGPFDTFSVFDAFALACAVRLMLETVARTFHAGVFAVKRVYRPPSSFIGPDVAEVLLLAALGPVLGTWALSAVVLVVGVLRAVLTMHYASRAYRGTRLGPWRLTAVAGARRGIDSRTLLGALRHAAANLTAQLDAALVLVLLRIPATGDHAPLAYALHLVRPLLGLGFSWSRLFYFDLKRLALRHSAFFRRRFEAFLRRVALGVGIATAVTCLAVVRVFFPVDLPVVLLSLLAVPRALYAAAQVQAFAYEHYEALWRVTLLVGAGLAIVAATAPPPTAAMLLMMAVLAAAARFSRAGIPTQSPEGDVAAVTGFLPFLYRLTTVPGRVRLTVAGLTPNLSVPRARVLRALAGALPGATISCWGRSSIVFFESTEPFATRPELLGATGGCLRILHQAIVDDAGPLRERAVRSMLIRHFGLEPHQAGIDHAALRQEFTRLFPEGHVLTARAGAVALPPRPPPHLAAAIAAEIEHQSSTGRAPRRRRLPIEISVYAPRGEPELVFVVPRACPASRRGEWKRRVLAATLCATLVRPEPHAPPMPVPARGG